MIQSIDGLRQSTRRDLRAAEVDDDDGGAALYGVRSALLLADSAQLLKLHALLGDDLMAARRSSLMQEYESEAYCAFCGGALVFSRFADIKDCYHVELREDHFVRGPNEQAALVVHAHHVLSAAVQLHTKSSHLVDALVIGPSRWTARELLFDQRLVVSEMVRSLNHGHELRLSVFALLRVDGVDT